MVRRKLPEAIRSLAALTVRESQSSRRKVGTDKTLKFSGKQRLHKYLVSIVIQVNLSFHYVRSRPEAQLYFYSGMKCTATQI